MKQPHALILLGAAAAIGGLVIWLGWMSGGKAAVGSSSRVASAPNNTGHTPNEGLLEVESRPNANDTSDREALVPTPSDPLTLEVPSAPPPAGELRLRAVGREGQPVSGVQFEWVIRSKLGGLRDADIKGETDTQGYLALEEAPGWWGPFFHPETSSAGLAGFFSAVGVRATLPFDEYEPTESDDAPGVHWLENEPQAGEPLDITLPAFGYVLVQWDAPEGALGEPLDKYFLHIRRSDGDHFPGWRTGFDVPVGATEHLFGPVGLGWEIYCDVYSRQVQSSLGNARAPGPRIDGETVPLRIEIPEENRTVARVMGIASDGTPISSRGVEVHLGDPEVKGTQRKRALTDELGQWSVDTLLHEISPVIYITAAHTKPTLRGTATLNLEDTERRVFEVGVVTLSPVVSNDPVPTWLASGRVTDAGGAPLASAWVSVEGKAASLNGKTMDADRWTRLSIEKTDKNGEYELEAVSELRDATLRIHASHGDYRRIEPVTIELGTKGVEFTLTRGFAVSLEVQIEPTFAITEAVSLRFSGAGRDHKPSLMDFMGRYGGKFGGLDEGTYSIEVRLHGGNYVLHEQTVTVSSDVDLGTIDLTGRLGYCFLELHDAGGAPLEKGYVDVSATGSETTIDRSSRVDERGRVSIVVPLDCDEVRISRRGAGYANVASTFFVSDAGTAPPEFQMVTLSR